MGFAPKFGAQVLDSAMKNAGTASEPGLVFEIRAVLAVLRGVPLAEIKRGYRPSRSKTP